MIARHHMLLFAAGCVAATTFGVFYGHGGIVALGCALALATVLAVATALELEPAQRRRPPSRAREDELPLPLRQIVDVLRESEHSAFSVDRSLRPLLFPIVAARLGRRGVDMALAPSRAQELLGDRLWEIVRPDRSPAAHRGSPGLSADDLREAIERLEQL